MPNATKEDVIQMLESIARMLELKGENLFKIRAYVNAARALETFHGDFSMMVAEARLTEIVGVGKAIADKITEAVQTGGMVFFANLQAEFPSTLFELFELQGVGPKKIKILWDELGIVTLQKLEEGCRDGRVAALKGFGKKTAENILKSIDERNRHQGSFLLGEVAAGAERMLEELRAQPNVSQVSLAGSYRRRKEVVRDIDYIVATRYPDPVSDFFVAHPMVESVIARGPTKSSVRWKSGIQADLRVVTNDQYAFALAYFTGSKEHNIAIRNRALARGWTLNEYRLGPDEKAKRTPEPIPSICTEEELHGALGLDYIPPELREDRGEVTAAEEHRLPDLVELTHLRGTFHNHTTASDGRNSLEEMAAAAIELGLQYLGIADHSKSSIQARGLEADRLRDQLSEVRRLNHQWEGRFRLFAGVECDILRDGTLDFPDDVLAELDYVVASVHSVFTLGEKEMTERIIRAISNPFVTMLGHLTGRLLLSRAGYEVNGAAIIEAAAATGTAIELNANPRRLEMDWRLWPLAKAKGVKCVINPDAHSTGSLQNLWFGVGTARKGWLTREDVLNCLPLGRIEAALARKRSRD